MIENAVSERKWKRLKRYIIGGEHGIALGDNNDNSGIVVKLPLTEKAVSWCSHNMATLKRLKQLNPSISFIVPEPLGEGTYNGQIFFVESELKGIAIDEPLGIFEKAFSNAVDFIIDFHQKTAKRQKVNKPMLEKLFQGCFKSLKNIMDKDSNSSIILKEYLKYKLHGKYIPLVIQHGVMSQK